MGRKAFYVRILYLYPFSITAFFLRKENFYQIWELLTDGIFLPVSFIKRPGSAGLEMAGGGMFIHPEILLRMKLKGRAGLFEA